MIRLIATDLDGTLLEPDGTLPDGIFDVIEALNALGIRFAAASGRQFSNVKRLFAPVADHMDFLCENGALCVVDGQCVGVTPIPKLLAEEMIRDIQAAGMHLLISGRDTCYVLDEDRRYTDDIIYRLRNTCTVVSSPEEITEPYLKVSGQIDEGLGRIAHDLLTKWAGKITASISGPDWFDFTVANKGTGIQMLMAHLHIQKEEAAAFGDSFNDEAMLDSVGYPFLMAHADPALRRPGVRLCAKVLPVLKAIVEARGDMGRFVSE